MRVMVFASLLLQGCIAVSMPGRSFRGPVPDPTPTDKQIAATLEADVRFLAEEVGPRLCWEPETFEKAAHYLEEELKAAGYTVERQTFTTEPPSRSGLGPVQTFNIVAEREGTSNPEEIVVIGAHFDTFFGQRTPGADDNASGVAMMLALARSAATRDNARTLRFIAFTNEEPPFFKSDFMGSVVAAKRSSEAGEKVVAMWSLETLGYYDDRPRSQGYPFPMGLFYPRTGDTLFFIGDYRSRRVVRQSIGAFREEAELGSVGGGLPQAFAAISFSDHWSYWQQGYRAVMITDTAFMRNPHYHRPSDTADTLDYRRMALAFTGLDAAVSALATPPEK